MRPILLTLSLPFAAAPVSIPSYGSCLMLAFLTAFVMGHRRGLKHGYSVPTLLYLYVVIFGCGMVGARTFHALADWDRFLANPWPYLRPWSGGGVFYGGLVGAIVGCAVYGRLAGIPWGIMADEAAPCVAWGHLVGRIGCLLNGCCFGRPSDVPWALACSPDRVLRHPTQLYEAAGLLVIFTALFRLVRRPHRDWSVATLYCALYGVLRLVLELYRGDDRGRTILGFLSVSQAISLGFLALAALLWMIARSSPVRSCADGVTCQPGP